MTPKKRFTPTIIVIAVLCVSAVAAAALNIDNILRRFSPEIYLSSRALNTFNELSREYSMIDDVLPKLKNLTESHHAKIEINGEKHRLSLEEDYNADLPSIYGSGIYNDLDFSGYITNSETGLSLPKFLDIYFTFSTTEFGDEFNSSSAATLVPLAVPPGIDLTLPKKSSSDNKQINTSEFIRIGKILLKDAQIRRKDGDDYYLILKSDNIKTAVSEGLTLISNTPDIQPNLKYAEDFLGISIKDDLLTPLSDTLQNADIGETVTAEFTECKNYISRFSTDIKSRGATTHISIDGSNTARLSEDCSVSIISEVDGSKIGLEYNQSGNRFFKDEDIEDNKELRIIFGDAELLNLKMETAYDAKNKISGKISLISEMFENMSLTFDGSYSDTGYTIAAQYRTSNESPVGTAAISVSEFQNQAIPEKQKFPFKDLNLSDLASLSEIGKEN